MNLILKSIFNYYNYLYLRIYNKILFIYLIFIFENIIILI